MMSHDESLQQQREAAADEAIRLAGLNAKLLFESNSENAKSIFLSSASSSHHDGSQVRNVCGKLSANSATSATSGCHRLPSPGSSTKPFGHTAVSKSPKNSSAVNVSPGHSVSSTTGVNFFPECQSNSKMAATHSSHLHNQVPVSPRSMKHSPVTGGKISTPENSPSLSSMQTSPSNSAQEKVPLPRTGPSVGKLSKLASNPFIANQISGAKSPVSGHSPPQVPKPSGKSTTPEKDSKSESGTPVAVANTASPGMSKSHTHESHQPLPVFAAVDPICVDSKSDSSMPIQEEVVANAASPETSKSYAHESAQPLSISVVNRIFVESNRDSSLPMQEEVVLNNESIPRPVSLFPCETDAAVLNGDESAERNSLVSNEKADIEENFAVEARDVVPAAKNMLLPPEPASFLRDSSMIRLKRKASHVVSFTTEDFDLFQTGSLAGQMSALMRNADVAKNNSASRRRDSKIDQLKRCSSRRRSRSVGSAFIYTARELCTVEAPKSSGDCVAKELKVQNRFTMLLGEDGVVLDCMSKTPDEIKKDAVAQPEDKTTTTPEFANASHGRHVVHSASEVVSGSKEKLLDSGSFPEVQGSGRKASSSSRHVSRKSTRRHLRHKSTQRKRRERDGDMDGFDENDICDNGDVEFSETDSENGQDGGSSTDESDIEFENSLAEKMNFSEDKVQDDSHSGPQMSMQQKIAMELLETERRYVQKLYLVDQIFHFTVVLANREHHMFPNEVIPRIFANVKSIYQFHNDFLLEQLERRMTQWDKDPRIGDVMRKFAPFLKLYSEYVKNFDNAMNTMSYWMDKSPRFMKIVEEIQRKPECGCLSLQHNMLEPIQRVPRYELLLKDYLKHLPDDSPDKEDTQKALDLVMTAAVHSNEAMRKIEKFRKLVDINESLGGEYDTISPTRELIKEGKLTRISARDGDLMDRYVFLFNDIFLVCKSLPLNIGQRQQYHVKTVVDVNGMEVKEGDNLETPNTFYVKGKQKSLELHTSSLEEKLEWMETLYSVIDDFNRTQRSSNLSEGGASLGQLAPIWIKDQETSMCMECSIAFTVIRRRHHCRACGHVVCGKCSSKRAALAYLDNRKQRVCNACFKYFTELEAVDTTGSQRKPLSPLAIMSPAKRKARVILQVKGSDPSVISGYLLMSSDARSWQRRWFAIHEDFVLYSFKAHQDVIALTAMPLPGYQVSAGEDSEPDAADKMLKLENPDKTFRVFHTNQRKIYYFQTDDTANRKRWLDVLQKVILLELPSPSVRLPSTSSSNSSSTLSSNSSSTVTVMASPLLRTFEDSPLGDT